MTGSDGADEGGNDGDGDSDEDLDELAPASSSSLRTAQEQDGGTDRIVERGMSKQSRIEMSWMSCPSFVGGPDGAEPARCMCCG